MLLALLQDYAVMKSHQYPNLTVWVMPSWARVRTRMRTLKEEEVERVQSAYVPTSCNPSHKQVQGPHSQPVGIHLQVGDGEACRPSHWDYRNYASKLQVWGWHRKGPKAAPRAGSHDAPPRPAHPMQEETALPWQQQKNSYSSAGLTQNTSGNKATTKTRRRPLPFCLSIVHLNWRDCWMGMITGDTSNMTRQHPPDQDDQGSIL